MSKTSSFKNRTEKLFHPFFIREANTRETSRIIYRRLKKEKVVRECERERERREREREREREKEREREIDIAEGAFLKFQTNLNKKIKLLAST